MRMQTLTAVLRKEQELYVAECPEAGTVSQGYTVEDAVANLKEATERYLEEFSLPEVAPPLLTHFEAESMHRSAEIQSSSPPSRRCK